MNITKNKTIESTMFYFLVLLVFVLPLSEAIKNLALILFILIGFYSSFRLKKLPKFDLLNISILLIPLMIIVGSPFAIDTSNTIKGVGSILTMGILFVYIRELQWNTKRISILLSSLFLGFLVTVLWGYYNWIYIGKTYLELHSVGHVNHSSIYMLLVFIISFIYLSINYNKFSVQKNIFILIVIIVSIVSVFMTGSRATMYTSIGIIFLFMIYGGLKINKMIIIIPLLLLLFLTLLFLLDVDSRMISKFEKGIFNNAPRLDLFIGFFHTWLNNNLLFGIGINNCGLIELKEYYNDSMFTSMSHAHSTYITYLVERGAIGFGLYLLFTFYLLFILIKNLIKDYSNSILIISILLWITNMIISFANTTFHHENAILMLIVWGISLEIIEDKEIEKT